MLPQPKSIDEALAHVRFTVTSARRVMGYLWMDEVAFFVAVHALKLCLSPELLRYARMVSLDSSCVTCLTAIDALEQSAEDGILHAMGSVLVNQRTIEDPLNRVETACKADARAASEWALANSPTPEVVLAEAYEQAEKIVAEARSEAAMIREGQSSGVSPGCPWSS